MMLPLIDFGSARAEPVIHAPTADRILSGAPQWRSWIYLAEAGMTSGVWESTPGRWTIVYDKWEFLRVIEGRGVVRGNDGSVLSLAPGTTAIIRPGFTGTWEVLETMRKHFFVRRDGFQ
jgi:uncharacterized cupin superfamily protein